jgi:hypothetical protein
MDGCIRARLRFRQAPIRADCSRGSVSQKFVSGLALAPRGLELYEIPEGAIEAAPS